MIQSSSPSKPFTATVMHSPIVDLMLRALCLLTCLFLVHAQSYYHWLQETTTGKMMGGPVFALNLKLKLAAANGTPVSPTSGTSTADKSSRKASTLADKAAGAQSNGGGDIAGGRQPTATSEIDPPDLEAEVRKL